MMNREILFGGKSPVTGEWVFGDLFQHGKQRFIMANNRNTEVIPETVGQYTGLTDKNGTKIFEGDIISIIDEGDELVRFIVEFGNCGGVDNVPTKVGYMGFHFAPADKNTKRKMFQGIRDDICYYLYSELGIEFKIIGNIHDNPELLEVAADGADQGLLMPAT